MPLHILHGTDRCPDGSLHIQIRAKLDERACVAVLAAVVYTVPERFQLGNRFNLIGVCFRSGSPSKHCLQRNVGGCFRKVVLRAARVTAAGKQRTTKQRGEHQAKNFRVLHFIPPTFS